MNKSRVGKLSTCDIMRVSRETFNKLSSVSQYVIDLSTIQKFFYSNPLCLSEEEIKDVELALLLISSAHEASKKNFNDARKSLNLCGFLSPYTGTAVQRVVHHFTKGLQARISLETGIISPQSEVRKILLSCEKTYTMNPSIAMSCARLPGFQIAQFTAIQELLDSLALARNVHIIDLAIRSGEHYSVLMQALANRHKCPLQLLKITAVGISEAKQNIEEVGKWLTSFAESLHLPFQFSIVDIKDQIFETSEEEVVAVFSQVGLRRKEVIPDHYLESLLPVLRTLNPCAFVIVELVSNHNSKVFIERFLEALMSYSACFDCIENCIGEEGDNRLALEAILGHEIKDIVAANNEDIIYRHLTISEWRDYFTKFGMVETDVGISCFDQATLLVKSLECAESCLLVKNREYLMIGWKGIPLLWVSSWKFQQGDSKVSTRI